MFGRWQWVFINCCKGTCICSDEVRILWVHKYISAEVNTGQVMTYDLLDLILNLLIAQMLCPDEHTENDQTYLVTTVLKLIKH